jgi:hypothetical protein
MQPPEIYVSTDIESDGPIPGPNSMLSFGSVALDETGKELGEFYTTLDLLPGAAGDPDTMKWWATKSEAWEAARRHPKDPKLAMEAYVAWVNALPGRPVFVAYPAGFDFTYVYWYMMKFAGRSPFSFSALDIKTFAMAVLGKTYRESVKKNMPKRWFPENLPHTHNALDDAREQGQLFINILTESRARPR